MPLRATAFVLAALAALAACAPRGTVDPGPDEFSVLPQRELADPAAGTLPAPGGGVAADRNAFALASAALGGTSATQAMTGATAAIVPELGGFWQRLWFRLFARWRAQPGTLDAEAEAARLKALGIPVAEAG